MRPRSLAAVSLLVLAVVAMAAWLVLPRLDAVEIVEALTREVEGSAREMEASTRETEPSRMTLEVRIRYRLASRPAAVLVVRAPAPDGRGDDASERIELLAGDGERRVSLAVPRREAALVLAELKTSPARGLWDRMMEVRRRDARAVGWR